jgi:hypothetical protein
MKGKGAPRKREKRLPIQIGVRLTPAVGLWLAAAAKDAGVGQSEYVRQLLSNLMKRMTR